MQITPEQYENIQNYLDDVMTPEEKRAFLNELNQNAILKESFDFEKELRDNLNSIQEKKELFEKPEDYYEVDKNADAYNSIKSLIETAGDEWELESQRLSPTNQLIVDNRPSRHKGKIVNIKSWIGIAAASCVILAIASLRLFWPKSYVSAPVAKTIDTSSVKRSTTNNNVITVTPNDSIKNSNSEIKKISPVAAFKRYYTKDMSSSPMPELLAIVPKDYQKGDYAYSEKIDLEHIPNIRGSSNDINSKQNILQLGHYYKGLSFIETNNNRQAIENLQWVIDNAQNKQLRTKATWYLALVYLKENDSKKAQPLLYSLSKRINEAQYQKQATEILEMLKGQQQK